MRPRVQPPVSSKQKKTKTKTKKPDMDNSQQTGK
jgi:Holliday junction resolvase RusA-like endonuclease